MQDNLSYGKDMDEKELLNRIQARRKGFFVKHGRYASIGEEQIFYEEEKCPHKKEHDIKRKIQVVEYQRAKFKSN